MATALFRWTDMTKSEYYTTDKDLHWHTDITSLIFIKSTFKYTRYIATSTLYVTFTSITSLSKDVTLNS